MKSGAYKMRTTINATDNEASIISSKKKGDTLTIVRLLREQPPKDKPFYGIYNQYDNIEQDVAVYRNPITDKSIAIPLQYPIGTEIGIRETWGLVKCLSLIDDFFAYKADNKYKKNQLYTERWQSSATKPEEAIIHIVKVTGNKVKRVQELTGFEWENLGASMNYYEKDSNGNWLYEHGDVDMNVVIYQWNSLHAKPEKKDDGYVSYVYSNYDFHWLCDKYPIIRKAEGDFYKGIYPLTINANPYIELFTTEVI